MKKYFSVFGYEEEFLQLSSIKSKWSILILILLSGKFSIPYEKKLVQEKIDQIQCTFLKLNGSDAGMSDFMLLMKELINKDKLLTRHGETETREFISEDIRHQAMGYFVLNCLQTDEDYKNYFKLSSFDSVFDYVRTVDYEEGKGERCLYLPREMEETLVRVSEIDIVGHHIVAQDRIKKIVSDIYTLGVVKRPSGAEFQYDDNNRFYVKKMCIIDQTGEVDLRISAKYLKDLNSLKGLRGQVIGVMGCSWKVYHEAILTAHIKKLYFESEIPEDSESRVKELNQWYEESLKSSKTPGTKEVLGENRGIKRRHEEVEDSIPAGTTTSAEFGKGRDDSLVTRHLEKFFDNGCHRSVGHLKCDMYGTAFRVGQRYLMTANHIIEGTIARIKNTIIQKAQCDPNRANNYLKLMELLQIENVGTDIETEIEKGINNWMNKSADSLKFSSLLEALGTAGFSFAKVTDDTPFRKCIRRNSADFEPDPSSTFSVSNSIENRVNLELKSRDFHVFDIEDIFSREGKRQNVIAEMYVTPSDFRKEEGYSVATIASMLSLQTQTMLRDKIFHEILSEKEKFLTATLVDFAGQCADYACHQIYLSSRAFYILVLDSSKKFEEINKEEENQKESIFSFWTCKDYFTFWMKSIRMNGCEKAPVIQVLTSEHAEARENSWSLLQDFCHEHKRLISDEDLCVQIWAHEMDSETFLLQDLFKKFDVTGLSLNRHKESTEGRFADCCKTLLREERIFKDVVKNEDIWWILNLILRGLLTTCTVDLNFQYMQCLDLMMTMEISLYQHLNLSMYTRIYGTKELCLEITENLNPSLFSNFHLQPCWFYFCMGLDCLTSHIQNVVDHMISLFEYTAYFLYEQQIVTIAVRNSQIHLQIIHLKEQPDDEKTKSQDAEKSVQRLQKCAPNLTLKGHIKQDEAEDTELTVEMEEEEEDSLETEYVELSDLEDDSTSSDNEEGQDIEINFSVQQPKETEESYRQSRHNLYRSGSFVIIGDIEKTEKGKGGDGSVGSEGRQQTYRNLLNSAEQERRRKVFCESSFYNDDDSFGWDSGELYSGSSLDSGEVYKDGNLKDTIHVSQNVTLWDKGIVPENSWIDVNYIVNQLVCLHENKDQEDSKMIETKEKVEKKCFREEKIQMFCLEKDTVLSGNEKVLMESKRKGRGKKRNSPRSKFRREKRRAQRSLREIINWQISLRRNAAVLCDYNSESGGQVSCALPAETNGTERIQEIANRELNNGIVQSPSAEVNQSIGEQQNGLPNGNSATFPRYVLERNQAGNMDASRHFFSNPAMEIERPQVEPLTRSLPAIYTVGPPMGGLSASEALPGIEESEASSPLNTENNAVPPTEEKESQGITATEEAVSTPSHPSVPPEADGQSMTSTSTPSHSSVPPEADGQSMTSTETLSSFFSSVSLSSVEEDEAFRYEWIRLKTFSTWPLTSLFSTAMARGGWVALGEGDKARCYSCHVVHQGWRIGDNLLDFHDRHCRFLQSVSDNVPIIREERAPTLRTVERDRERLPEYCEVAPQGNVTGQVPRPEEERNIVMNLTSKDVGEPFQEERGNLVVESSNPGNVTTNLQMSERPPVYNSSYTSRPAPQLIAPVESNPILKHSPSNPQGHSAAGPPPLPPGREAQLEALRRDPMGINFDRPKYPSYAILAVRISSFTDWPTAMTQTPRDMALAGFFYAGYGDYTRCFFCGGGLRNWEAGDDPWVEHARWFSKCAFVRQNRGQQFIDLVLRRAAEMEEQRSQDEAGNSQTNSQTNTQTSDAAQTLAKEEKIMKSAAVISIKDMGYSEDIIKTAITTIKSRLPRGKHKVSAQEILEVIFELADSQRASENSSSQSEPHRNVHQSESSSAPAVHSGATTENVTNNVSQSNSTTDKTDQSTSEEAAATGSSNAGEVGTGESISNFLSNPTYDELTSLRQENTSLKDQIVCKICMEKNVSIAFLPCGHLACCADCAPAMRKCPICREFVRGTVKTYLV